MDKSAVFADTHPRWGIRVAQATGHVLWIVNDHTFTSVAFNLVDHCFALCRASFSYWPMSSYASLSTVFNSPASVSQANIKSLARTEPIVGVLSQKSSLIVRLLSTAQSRLQVHQQQA